MHPDAPQASDTAEGSWPWLLPLLVLQLWAAHAIAFFAHEYSHSFVAWMLGWKTNPLALNYAHPTLTVLLIQLGINENVNQQPIFASHHGVQAAIISAAGAFLGNALITFPLSRWGYHVAQRHAARGWAMFCYWLCVASVGNLVDYVPVRVFTNGGDMYNVERGMGWSPWTLLLVFGIPTTVVLIYFLFRIEPRTLRWLFPGSPLQRGLLAVLTAFVLFGFYGAAGWSGSSPVAHQMSVISALVAAPLMAVLGVALTGRRHARP